VRLVVLERVQQTLGAHEAPLAHGLGIGDGLTAAREEVDPGGILAAQRVALPGRAVEELDGRPPADGTDA
jgi:hypothetical protein